MSNVEQKTELEQSAPGQTQTAASPATVKDKSESVQQNEFNYKSGIKSTWCPGCGDFGVLSATYNALKEKKIDPKDVVSVSGIGCSSRIPFFISTYGFHSIHGRTLPIAVGIKTANPDLKVIVFSGDGDCYSIGLGHFIHTVRRNLDITLVVMDNSIYGLTKGQTSPTSSLNFVTKTTPDGNIDGPVNPIALALVAGATFVARGFSADAKGLAKLIVEGMDHKGFSMIDVYSPCPTFNHVDTFDYYKEHVVPMPKEHNVEDFSEALMLAISPTIHIGAFYKKQSPTFEENIAHHHKTPCDDKMQLLEKLFKKFS